MFRCVTPPPSFWERCFWSSFYEWGLGFVWLGYFFVENCIFLYFHMLALFAGGGSGRRCFQIPFRPNPRRCYRRRRGHESDGRLFMVLLESGFEYVSDYEGRKVLRKRK